MSFGFAISVCVFLLARPLMTLFIDAGETAVIAEGVRYLRIEGAFYFMIAALFLLYGLYRALGKPGMSVILTVVSLALKGLSGLRAFSDPAVRSGRDMVVCPDRMVPC